MSRRAPDESIHRSLRGLSTATMILRGQRGWWWKLSLLITVLCISALAIISQVESQSRQLVKEQLISAREANVEALRLWLAWQEANVGLITDRKAVRDVASVVLTDANQKDAEALERPSPEGIELSRTISASTVHLNQVGWALVDLQGRVVLASEPHLIGRVDFGLPTTCLGKVLAGESSISIPFELDLNERSDPVPVIAAIAPLHDADRRVVGGLSLLLDPAAGFSQVLAVSQAGQSDETYAIDRQGRMLSSSRFESQLRRIGRLPEDDKVSSVLKIEVRDPGVNLLEEPGTKTETQLPLTRMAEQLVQGNTGEDVSGYRDYRGVQVVGAWKWLPKYDFGIATEMDVVDAYRPVLLLRRLLWGLGAITLIAVSVIVILGVLVTRFRQRADESEHKVRRMGQYTLLEPLGSGGMGTVYLGRHTFLRRPVAIKVLRQQLIDDPHAKSRFEREVQLTSRLTSVHTVTVFDYGTTTGGEFFYVMEYLQGIDLSHLVGSFGAMPASRVIHLLIQVCDSLDEAHSIGLVHRDVKPANLILCMRGVAYDFVKLVDFGLVKHEAASAMLTRTGAMAGTPMYMSPEAVRDPSLVTAQSDIYSLGAVAYWLLTGTPLFEAGPAMEVCLRQVAQEPALPSSLVATVPNDLEEVVMRCLNKESNRRPQSASHLKQLLAGCRDAGKWTQKQAERWWKEEFLPTRRGDTLHRQISEPTEHGQQEPRDNIQIDASLIH